MVKEVLLVLLYWLHTIAAIALLSGIVFPFLLWRLPDSVEGRWRQTIAAKYILPFWISILALIISGGIIALDRLTSPMVNWLYVLLLGAKVLMAAGLLHLWGAMSRRLSKGLTTPDASQQRAQSLSYIALALGIGIVLLASILRIIYESSLKGG